MRIAGLLLFLCAFARAEWTQVNGPFGYLTESILAKDDFLFAGNNHGIFRSRNGGATWERMVEKYSSQGFAVSGRFILARSRFHVIRSGDDGETWQTVHAGLPDSLSTAIVAMGDKAFVGNFRGVYRSLDQGGSWAKASQGLEDTAVAALLVHGSSILARTSTGLFRSADSGQTWRKAGTGLPESRIWPTYQIFARCGGDLFTLIEGRIYRSGDGGSAWAPVPGTLPDTSITAIFDDGIRLYAGTFSGLFRSSDQGASFAKVNRQVGTRMMAISADHRGDELWLATTAGVFRSRDQGVTLGGFNKGMSQGGGNAFLSEGGDLFATSMWGIACRSSDLGTTWTLSPDTSLFSRVNALAWSGGALFAGTEVQGVRKSLDRGTTWLPASRGLEREDEENVSALVAEGAYLHAATGNGLYRSQDGGASWSKRGEGLPPGYSVACLRSTGSGLYAWSGSRLYRSQDHASTWIAAGDTVPGSTQSRFAVMGDVVVVAAGNRIHRSADRGATWALVALPDSLAYLTAVEATQVGFLAGTMRGEILHSGDSGISWIPRNEGIGWSNAFVNAFGEAGDHVFVSAGGIYSRPYSDFAPASIREEARGRTASPRIRLPFALRLLRRLGVDILGRSDPRQ